MRAVIDLSLRLSLTVNGSRATLAVVLLVGSTVLGQPVKNRIAVLISTDGQMSSTPQQITFPESCTALGFNGCTASGNPTAAQEVCNACVADTIHFSASCATNWSATCRNQYTQCVKALTGSPTCTDGLNLVGPIATRGDGSSENPGCDVNGDGLPNDSALYQADEDPPHPERSREAGARSAVGPAGRLAARRGAGHRPRAPLTLRVATARRRWRGPAASSTGAWAPRRPRLR